MTEIIQINTQQAPTAIGPYSQAVRAGSFVFVSGQLPLDPATGKMVDGDIRAMTKRVMENLESILKEAGLGFENVVRMDIFMKDLSEFTTVNDEYGKHFKSHIKPARQTIQVAKLPLDAPMEISCIAFKP